MAERQSGIDGLKALAVTAVVGIHVLGAVYHPRQAEVGLALWGILSAAVPAFIALSLLFLGAEMASARDTAPIRRRLVRLVPIYFTWTVVYLVFAQLMGDDVVGLLDRDAAGVILRGGAAQHLYFLPVLIELLVLTPLLYAAASAPTRARSAVAAGVVLLTAALVARREPWVQDLVERDVALVWVPTAIVGLAAGRRTLRVPWPAVWWLGGLVVNVLVVVLVFRREGLDPHRSYALAPLPLIAAGLVSQARSVRAPDWLTALGRRSLGVYLVHMIVLRLIVDALDLQAVGLAVVVLLTLAVAGLSWALVEVLERTPLAVLFDGRRRQPARSTSR